MIHLPPHLTSLSTMLAQSPPARADQVMTAASESAGGGDTLPPQSGGSNMILILLPMMLVAMIAISAMSGRKEKRRRADLMGSLARHDRVRTTGGVIGTIMEIRDDEVVLKVDEATNTRITFDKGAIQGVIKHAKGAGVADAAESVEGDAEYATS